MKLNFWQWLGVILLIAGLALILGRGGSREGAESAPAGTPPAATQPR